ncbi:flavin reductase [Streptomyces hirsutus]|uniref:flavin reductase n=1 Tax=Streptomyces hirsutus TaxID=35620 RepID=UPI003323A15D
MPPDTSVLSTSAPEAIDPQVMRQVLGNYPTGVAVVTGRAPDGTLLGMVVGTFSSVSMEPPLVSFMPMKTSRTFTALRECASFCVNILAADQSDVCGSFMRPPEEKFRGLRWRAAPNGAPVIEGVTAWIECTWADVIEVGDHYFALGAIQSLATERDCLPLLFFQRGYGRFTPGLLMTSDHRSLAAAVGVAERGRLELERLASELGAEVSLLAPLGDEFAFVATAGSSGGTTSPPPGTRLPFAPPLGMLLVGHPGAPSAGQWLDRVPASAPQVREAAAVQLRRTQERGWSLTLHGPLATALLDELVDAFSEPARTPDNERRLLEALRRMTAFHEPEQIAPDRSYSVLQVSVPVCDAEGNAVLVLRLSGLPRSSSGAEIIAFVDRLRLSARAIERTLTPVL